MSTTLRTRCARSGRAGSTGNAGRAGAPEAKPLSAIGPLETTADVERDNRPRGPRGPTCASCGRIGGLSSRDSRAFSSSLSSGGPCCIATPYPAAAVDMIRSRQPMISAEMRAKIRRLFYAEHWRVGTIAEQLDVHRDTVLRALNLEDALRRPARAVDHPRPVQSVRRAATGGVPRSCARLSR